MQQIRGERTAKNSLAGVIVDRFGKEIPMTPAGTEHFTVHVDVAVSRPFVSWIFSLGSGARIVGPEYVVDKVKKKLVKT